MKQLILLVGPPGSGKSSKAYKIRDDENFAYINQDSQGKEHLQLFNKALLERQSIVVDRMNFNKEQRNRYLEPAKKQGYNTKIIVLHESYETCLNRCLKRIGHETIKDEVDAKSALNMFFAKYERVEDNETDVIERIWPDGPKPFAIICDLDGTLCNIDHRLHHVRRTDDKSKDWKSFFEGIPNDSVNDWCKTILNGIESNQYIVLCSGRPDSYRKITEEWLKNNDISYNKLFMRNRADHRQDNITKELILDFEILTRYTPYFAIDDRSQVVEMWRKRGIICLQCNEGDF